MATLQTIKADPQIAELVVCESGEIQAIKRHLAREGFCPFFVSSCMNRCNAFPKTRGRAITRCCTLPAVRCALSNDGEAHELLECVSLVCDQQRAELCKHFGLQTSFEMKLGILGAHIFDIVVNHTETLRVFRDGCCLMETLQLLMQHFLLIEDLVVFHYPLLESIPRCELAL